MISTILEAKTNGEPPRSTAYYYADLEKYHRKQYEDQQSTKPYQPKPSDKFSGPNSRNNSYTKTLRTPLEIQTHQPNELSEYVEANEVINEKYNRKQYEDQQPTIQFQHKLSDKLTGPNSRNNSYPRTLRTPLEIQTHQPNELSEYVESNEVINDGAIRKIPPFRDRKSNNHYSVPERKDTYSTAGTFPMPEPKDKEPLLAELEIVGRLPLSQLDSTSTYGVRRSRSWYFCCPNVADDEISRDSSWRYSSLRPVTAPPAPGRNGFMVATQSTGQDDVATLKAERDALALALATERQRAASAARATDARLAELHGVIAELVRRRAADKSAIVEESDECESTTQPAGELDNDADQSRTDQNDSSSLLSPEPVTPQEERREKVEDTNTDTSTPDLRQECPGPVLPDHSWRQSGCDLDPGSSGCLHPPTKGRCSSRQAKIASRVRLRRTDDSDSNHKHDESWCIEACEKLALDVCAQADVREAILAATQHDESPLSLCVSRLCAARADLAVLARALTRANHTAHRLSSCCASLESSCISAYSALKAADQAIEIYDVLLALAETSSGDGQRVSAEQVACQLVQRLEGEAPRVGDPIVSPGPWQQHRHQQAVVSWSVEVERSLRRRAAQLKADTVRLRNLAPEPHFFSYYDPEEDDLADSVNNINIAEMEAAVMVQEVMSSREAAALARLKERDSQPAHQQRPLAGNTDKEGTNPSKHKTNSSRRRREHAWIDARAAETDL